MIPDVSCSIRFSSTFSFTMQWPKLLVLRTFSCYKTSTLLQRDAACIIHLTETQDPWDLAFSSAFLSHRSRCWRELGKHNQDHGHSIQSVVGECPAMSGFEEDKVPGQLLLQRSWRYFQKGESFRFCITVLVVSCGIVTHQPAHTLITSPHG